MLTENLMEAILMRILHRYSRHLALIVLAIAMADCTPKGEPKPKGGFDSEVIGAQNGFIVIEKDLSPYQLIQGILPHRDTFNLDSDNVVIVSRDFAEGYYTVYYDDNKLPVYFFPGKRFSVDIDVKHPSDKPEYTGKLKYEGRYIFDRNRIIAKQKANASALYTMPVNEFTTAVFQSRKSLDTLLVTLITNRPQTSGYFLKSESLNNFYYTATYLAAYPELHHQLVPESQNQSVDTIYTNLAKVPVNDTNASDNRQYYEYLEAWLDAMAYRKLGNSKSIEALGYKEKMILSKIEQNEYRDFTLFITLQSLAKTDSSAVRDSLQYLGVNAIQNDAIKKRATAFFEAKIVEPELPEGVQ